MTEEERNEIYRGVDQHLENTLVRFRCSLSTCKDGKVSPVGEKKAALEAIYLVRDFIRALKPLLVHLEGEDT